MASGAAVEAQAGGGVSLTAHALEGAPDLVWLTAWSHHPDQAAGVLLTRAEAELLVVRLVALLGGLDLTPLGHGLLH